MKKLFLSCAALLAVSAMQAQLAQTSAPQRLLEGVQSQMYNPVLSQDGNLLLFSQEGYTDLREYNFTDNVTRSIKAEPTKAFKAGFKRDAVVFDNAGDKTTVRTEGDKLFIKTGGKEKAYTPVECQAGYCWASLSPDGTKVVFLAAGKGLVVCDLNGNVLSRPGNYEAPVWFGNDYLVVQNATDDCHQICSSQILLLKADGSAMQELTKPESMTMTPAASFSAGRIVYSTIDGRMYQMFVKLNK